MRIAINGFGRIGRNVVRAIYENTQNQDFTIVAINDLGDVATNAHLLKYDSTHGIFAHEVSTTDDKLIINEDEIQVLAIQSPTELPWQQLNIDIVFECTGLFANKDAANQHLASGARKVLISAPAGNDVKTIVYGVNHITLDASDNIVSNASCTTNCLAPLVKPLHESIGLESGLMTTIHAYTNDQVLVDVYHQDLRRARSATQSMIPTKTGAAAAVGLVLPELAGKLDGFAMRVPTLNVSVVDLSFIASANTSVEEVNSVLTSAIAGDLAKVAALNNLPLVSVDYNHNAMSSIFDLTQTKVIGKLVKVLAWYDNEWGFSNRMLDTARHMVSI